MNSDWRAKLAFPFGIWAASRLLILIWSITLTLIVPVQPFLVGDNPLPPVADVPPLLEPWARWDTIWYLRIAQTGYATSDLTGGFFPLYPLLIRGLTFVIPNALVSGLVISNLATLGALSLFYQVALDLFDEATARRASIYWIAFPTSFYFFAGYPESLLAVAVLLSVYAARTDRWTLAGIAGGLAALARPPGFAVLAPLAIEWAKIRKDVAQRIRRLIPLALIPLSLGTFTAYLYFTFGDALFWLHAWNNVVGPPWDLAIGAVGNAFAGIDTGSNLFNFLSTATILSLCLAGGRHLPWSLTIYGILIVLVQMLAYPPALGFANVPMAGLSRRVIVAFPAFLVLARIWQGKFKEPIWIAFSIFLQLILIGAFINWLWLA